MNFLGHFYLSHYDEELTVGNYIADFVKGKKYLEYPKNVSKGIMMHREIDHFTDGSFADGFLDPDKAINPIKIFNLAEYH